MSHLEEPFDPVKEQGTPPIDLLQPGKYRAEVVDASVRKSRNQLATLLDLNWEITQEGFERRHVFQTIITRHQDSQDAERFGRYMLKDLCVACDINEAVTEVGVFYFKPCIIAVKIERDRDGIYADKNRVTRILPVTAATVTGPVVSKADTASPVASKADTNGPDTSTKIDTSMPPSNTGPTDVPYWDDIPF